MNFRIFYFKVQKESLDLTQDMGTVISYRKFEMGSWDVRIDPVFTRESMCKIAHLYKPEQGNGPPNRKIMHQDQLLWAIVNVADYLLRNGENRPTG